MVAAPLRPFGAWLADQAGSLFRTCVGGGGVGRDWRVLGVARHRMRPFIRPRGDGRPESYRFAM
jgi:hypothetical protein